MSHLLTALGEEYLFTTDVDGATWTVGLYNDGRTGGDDIQDGDDIGDVTTEPSNANYSSAGDTVTVENPTGTDVVVNNDSQLSFDFSDQSSEQWVDSYYVTASFQSTTVVGDSSATDHLIYTSSLEADREIGSIDTLDIDAGGIELELE